MSMNKKGVSVLVGFILLMMTLMIFLAILQTQMVPSMCKDAEFKHLNKIIDELQTLSKDIIDNRLTTVTLDLGISYPRYPLLISPPTMASSVTSKRYAIELSYEEILPNGSIISRSSNYTTDSIEIYLNYFYNRGYKLLFENTAILRFIGRRFIGEAADQQMFTRDEIRIPLINATFESFTSSQPIDLVVVPISYGGYVMAKNVTIRFRTDCPSYWIKIKPKLENMGYNVTVSGNNVTVTYQNVTKLEISYTVLLKGVSVSALQYSNIETPKPFMIIPTNPTTNYSVRIGESIVLGVKVLDEYNNPVRGYPVNVTLTGVGSITPSVVYTDKSGCANVVFSSNKSGEATVNFSASCGFVLYKISVIGTGVQLSFPYGVTYDANTPGAVFAFGNETYLNPPSSNTTPTVPLPTTNITKDDGVYLVSEAVGTGYHAAQRFEIYGLNTTNVIETYVNWNGYGVGRYYEGESLYIWNYTKGAYDLIAANDSSQEVWLGVGLNSIELQNYVRNGKMIVLVVQNDVTYEYWKMGVLYRYPSKLYTDYVGVFQILK